MWGFLLFAFVRGSPVSGVHVKGITDMAKKKTHGGTIGGRDKPHAGACAFRKEKACKTSTGKLSERVRAREAFYGPTIMRDTDAAVDFALSETGNSQRYRRIWCFYCLRIGINTFLDQLDAVMSCYRQGEIRNPASAFHARLRHMKSQLDGNPPRT